MSKLSQGKQRVKKEVVGEKESVSLRKRKRERRIGFL